MEVTTLRPRTLARLQLLNAQVEGARAAAQAAVDAHTQLLARLNTQLTDACEDAGLQVPSHHEGVSVDWDTGTVTVNGVPSSNGHVQEEVLA